jgi:hypothetical protein
MSNDKSTKDDDLNITDSTVKENKEEKRPEENIEKAPDQMILDIKNFIDTKEFTGLLDAVYYNPNAQEATKNWVTKNRSR